MRTITLLALLALGGCGPSNSNPDMQLLGEGQECNSGIGPTGTCAPGLKCCTIQVQCGEDGGCLDVPSRCTSMPAPGQADCF